MIKNYELYFADIETVGLGLDQDIIELSLYRLSNGSQKTWKLKAVNTENIDDGALRVNGHKREDITWMTKFGRETYLEPNKAIIDIENFILEDGVSAETRALVCQNAIFDKPRLEELWKKCGTPDSFPFGRRYMDTIVIAMFMDYIQGTQSEGYSLANLTKKYGIKNTKAHSAEADTVACKDVFLKQVEELRKKINITIPDAT